MISGYTKAATIAGLLLIMGIGAWLRLAAIDRLPPLALHPDEGYYGVDALQIMQGHWMVYSPENTGREALFATLAAGVFAVFGVSTVAFRAFTAGLGVLTLPAIFWLGWEAAPKRGSAAGLGLLAAASVAVLLMHVVLNRHALRVNMGPLFTALTLASLLRAFRWRSRRWFIITGVLLGLSGYTYVTVRSLPIVILIAFGLWWPSERAQRRDHLWGLGWVAGLALLIYTPLGLYFLGHPELFLHRATSLFDVNSLGRSTWATVLMFHINGDPVVTNNLPGRPVFDALQAIAFWVGALAAFTGRYQRAGHLMLIWFVSGVLPSALASDAPSYIHAFGMVPPLAVLMGGGYLLIGRWVADQLHRIAGRPALARMLGAAVVALGLSYSAEQTYQDFFIRWAGRADLSLAYRTDLLRIDEYVRNSPGDAEFFFSPYARIESSLVFLRRGDVARLHPFEGDACMPLGNAAQHPLIYLVGDRESLPVLRRYFPGGEESAAPEFEVFRVPAGSRTTFASGAGGQAVWAEQLALLSAEVQREAQAIKVNLAWQTRPSGSTTTYQRFIHLLSDDPAQPGGVRLWAQDDRPFCGGSHAPVFWQAGEIVLETGTLTAAEPLPPGNYRVEVGLYQLGAPARLAVTKSSWPVKNQGVSLATLQVK